MNESSIEDDRTPESGSPENGTPESAPIASAPEDPIDLSILASHPAKSAFGLCFVGFIFVFFTSRAHVNPTLSLDLLPGPFGWGMILLAIGKLQLMSPRVAALRTLAWVLFGLSVPASFHVDAEYSPVITITQSVIWIVSSAGILWFAWQLSRLIERMAEVTQEPDLAAHARFRRRLWLVLAAVGAFLSAPALLGVPLIPTVVMTLAIGYLVGTLLLLELLWRTRNFCQRHIRLRAEAESHAASRGSEKEPTATSG